MVSSTSTSTSSSSSTSSGRFTRRPSETHRQSTTFPQRNRTRRNFKAFINTRRVVHRTFRVVAFSGSGSRSTSVATTSTIKTTTIKTTKTTTSQLSTDRRASTCIHRQWQWFQTRGRGRGRCGREFVHQQVVGGDGGPDRWRGRRAGFWVLFSAEQVAARPG